MKAFILHIALLCVSLVSMAQNDYTTQDALIAYKAGDLIKARDIIHVLLDDEEHANDSQVWNFKGHVYKELYKQEKDNANSENRDIAVEAFLKSSEIRSEGKFHVDNIKALDYLCATYFNDAIKGAINLRYDQDEDPVEYFEKFKRLKKDIYPEQDITREELEFLKMLAQGFEKIHSSNGKEDDQEFMGKAIENYEKALSIDPMDYEANFNLAIVYYNEGASSISEINYQTGFNELLEIQNKCVELFKSALPYMETADQIKPNRMESIKGLMFINRALNNFDKYLEYKVRLEKILKK